MGIAAESTLENRLAYAAWDPVDNADENGHRITSRNVKLTKSRYKHIWKTHSYEHAFEADNMRRKKSYFSYAISSAGEQGVLRKVIKTCLNTYSHYQNQTNGNILAVCGTPYIWVGTDRKRNATTKLFSVVINPVKRWVVTAFPSAKPGSRRRPVRERVPVRNLEWATFNVAVDSVRFSFTTQWVVTFG